MRVLVGYEISGRVREAFRKRGHDCWSCDLLPSLDNSPYHIISPIQSLLEKDGGWDLLIAHPPCTALCVSGNGTYAKGKPKEQERIDALDEIRWLMSLDIPKIAIENPVGIISTHIRKPDQYVQPWMFGHKETKKTGLWLKNLPKLKPTNVVEGPYEQKIWKMGPSKERSMLRSLTYQGIAEAMAEQWS